MHPFIISAPSMVFGKDLAENVKRLSRLVDHIEIVVFHTPELHNIPTSRDILFMKKIKAEKKITYSVHLPASFEIAAQSRQKREMAIQIATQIIDEMAELDPEYYILHVPVATPTLTAEPGCYMTDKSSFRYAAWADRALESLGRIQEATGLNRQLLLENINYSPVLLEEIWQKGLCAFCLDIGHLLLGGESVLKVLKRYLPVVREIHIHGVVGWEEHLGLDVLPPERVRSWFDFLNENGYAGILNIEVFDPQDLAKSLQLLEKIQIMET